MHCNGYCFGRNSCSDETSGSAKIVVARKRQRGEIQKGLVVTVDSRRGWVGVRGEYEEVDGWEHWSEVKLLVWLPW